MSSLRAMLIQTDILEAFICVADTDRIECARALPITGEITPNPLTCSQISCWTLREDEMRITNARNSSLQRRGIRVLGTDA